MKNDTSWYEITVKQQLELERLASIEPDYKPIATNISYCNILYGDRRKLHISKLKKILSSMTFISHVFQLKQFLNFDYKEIGSVIIINRAKKQSDRNCLLALFG